MTCDNLDSIKELEWEYRELRFPSVIDFLESGVKEADIPLPGGW